MYLLSKLCFNKEETNMYFDSKIKQFIGDILAGHEENFFSKREFKMCASVTSHFKHQPQ